MCEASEGWQLESTEKMEVRKELTATIAAWDLGNLVLFCHLYSVITGYFCLTASLHYRYLRHQWHFFFLALFLSCIVVFLIC